LRGSFSGEGQRTEIREQGSEIRRTGSETRDERSLIILFVVCFLFYFGGGVRATIDEGAVVAVDVLSRRVIPIPKGPATRHIFGFSTTDSKYRISSEINCKVRGRNM
jgi:hypothetical protein